MTTQTDSSVASMTAYKSLITKSDFQNTDMSGKLIKLCSLHADFISFPTYIITRFCHLQNQTVLQKDDGHTGVKSSMQSKVIRKTDLYSKKLKKIH